jgi:hypothetical protein
MDEKREKQVLLGGGMVRREVNMVQEFYTHI